MDLDLRVVYWRTLVLEVVDLDLPLAAHSYVDVAVVESVEIEVLVGKDMVVEDVVVAEVGMVIVEDIVVVASLVMLVDEAMLDVKLVVVAMVDLMPVARSMVVVALVVEEEGVVNGLSDDSDDAMSLVVIRYSLFFVFVRRLTSYPC